MSDPVFGKLDVKGPTMDGDPDDHENMYTYVKGGAIDPGLRPGELKAPYIPRPESHKTEKRKTDTGTKLKI